MVVRVRHVLFAAVVLAADAEAEACSVAGLQPHVLDPAEQQLDTMAPGAPGVAELRVKRGVAGNTSCDDLGFITITPAPPVDDRTPAESLGYQLRLVEGELPSGLKLPEGPVRARTLPDEPDPTARWIGLHWIDGASGYQEAISFTLSLAAVDLAGNVGEPVAVVIDDPGSCGCRVASPRHGARSAVVLLVLLGA